MDGDHAKSVAQKPAAKAASATAVEPGSEDLKEITKNAMASIRRAKKAGALTPALAEAIPDSPTADTAKAKSDADSKAAVPARPVFWLP